MKRIHTLLIGTCIGWILSACSPTLPSVLPPLPYRPPSHYVVNKTSAPIPKPTAKATARQQRDATSAPSKKPTPPSPKPKNTTGLQKVEDTNFDPDYMYPETSRRTKTTPQKSSRPLPSVESETMDKARCIKMLGQEKFARFIEMLGSEAATIKRCALMQRMR